MTKKHTHLALEAVIRHAARHLDQTLAPQATHLALTAFALAGLLVLALGWSFWQFAGSAVSPQLVAQHSAAWEQFLGGRAAVVDVAAVQAAKETVHAAATAAPRSQLVLDTLAGFTLAVVVGLFWWHDHTQVHGFQIRRIRRHSK